MQKWGNGLKATAKAKTSDLHVCSVTCMCENMLGKQPSPGRVEDTSEADWVTQTTFSKALGRQRQESVCEFQTSLIYIVRPCLKKQNNKNNT